MLYYFHKMKRPLPAYADIIEQLTASLWLGSVISVLIGTSQSSSAAWILPFTSVAGRIAEICGLLLVGLYFLGRRRYESVRSLFILDGVRQLIAFGSLFLNELVRYGVMSSGGNASLGTVKFTFGIQGALLIVMIILNSLLQSKKRIVSGGKL